MAVAYRCLPKRFDRRSNATRLAAALHAAGVISNFENNWTCEAIAAGNAAAHVGAIDRYKLRGGLALCGSLIEEYPNGVAVELVKGGAV
jgi:hypothetical protein